MNLIRLYRTLGLQMYTTQRIFSPLLLSPLLFTSLLACTGEKIATDTDSVTTEPSSEDTATSDTASLDTAENVTGVCGDGIVNTAIEECDDGEANANSPNACRTDCLLPKCGDGIQDDGEECDDNNLWNVDGCSKECYLEVGTFALEPNNEPATAILLEESGVIKGSLFEQDRDCFTVEFEDNDFIDFHVNPSQTEDCSHLMRLRIYEDNEEVETIIPLDGTCPHLDPLTTPSARFRPADSVVQTTFCLEGMFGTAVEEYELSWEISSNSCTLVDPILTETEDVDGDLLANNCDNDDDGDSILDEDDNCPLHSNNGPVEFYPSSSGYIKTWLLTPGLYVSPLATVSCHTIDNIYETAETDIVPSLSTPLIDFNGNTAYWGFYDSPTDRIDYNVVSTLATLSPARNVFSGIWAYTESSRSVDVKFGPDDAGRVWVNGVLVGESQVCQGASVDKYSFPTTLNAGWNYVLTQVHDNGGGWGMYFRFMESGVPVTDLILSPVANGIFQDYQSDSDGDGIGDRCDLPD